METMMMTMTKVRYSTTWIKRELTSERRSSYSPATFVVHSFGYVPETSASYNSCYISVHAM